MTCRYVDGMPQLSWHAATFMTCRYVDGMPQRLMTCRIFHDKPRLS